MTSDRQRLERYDASTSTYLIMQITDEDHESQVTLEDGETYFEARLRHDRVHRHVDAAGVVRYSFEHIPDDAGGEVHVHSKFGEVDTDTFRGGEFSELLKWGRHMLVFDDRTGIVGELRGRDHMIIPRQILMTGSGDEAQKGFKCEWATLRGDELIVGSHGKVRREEWVKRLGPDYTVVSEDRALPTGASARPAASRRRAISSTRRRNDIPIASAGTSFPARSRPSLSTSPSTSARRATTF